MHKRNKLLFCNGFGYVVVYIILWCALLSGGCHSSVSTISTTKPNDLYVPRMMQWYVLKLEAYNRVPFGARGFPYSLDVVEGVGRHEVVIRISFTLPEKDSDEMVIDIRHVVGEVSAAISQECMSTSVETMLFPTIELNGKGFELLKEEYSESTKRMRKRIQEVSDYIRESEMNKNPSPSSAKPNTDEKATGD